MSDVIKPVFEDKTRKTYYWLGMPCKFSDDPDLAFLPEAEDGGRALALPAEAKPQQLFDTAMPLLGQVYADAKRQSMMQGGLSPLMPLAQSIQVVWIFAAQEMEEVNTKILKLQSKVEELEKKLDQVIGGT